MSQPLDRLVADNLDIWTSATLRKSGAGRGGGKQISLYGIERLRALILDLAVRGKLVPQDAGEESAGELLKAFVTQRSDWISKKRMRNGKPLPNLAANELRFEAPLGWAWVRFGNLGDWGAGATPNRKKSVYYGGDIPWFKSGELSADFITASEESVTELALKDCSLRLNRPGDVLIAMYGATIGKASILEVEATTNQAVCACTPFEGVDNRFLLLLLKGMKPIFVGQGAGGAQPNISREKIIATPLCLPPLSEQCRIVAKVDELMALCDALERESAGAMAAHQVLVEELLATLVNSADAADLAANWARLESHFDTLFTTDASIEALKQTILDLAVRGILVAGVETKDKSRSTVALASKAKKAMSEAEGLRARTPIARGKLSRPEEAFPSHWTFTDFDSVFVTVSGVTKGQKISLSEAIEAPYLRVANVQRGQLDLDEMKTITVKHSDFKRYQLRDGDVLMTEGGDWDKLGRAAIWRNEVSNCIHQNHVFRVRFEQNAILPEWVVLFVNSPLGREFFSRAAKQTTNLASINMTQLRSCPIPIPAYAEQHRIVAKVDALMALCDQLKTRLADAAQTQRHLADAITERAAA